MRRVEGVLNSPLLAHRTREKWGTRHPADGEEFIEEEEMGARIERMLRP
jgi:hypothetical protein